MQPGTIVADRFEIEVFAGAGGMGQIYRARDLQTGAPVALKLILRELSAEHAARFETEAQLLAELQHPHVVRYITHGATDRGAPYLVMEWLEGEDLATRLGRSGLSVEESLALGIGVAEALDAIHGRGIFHRDLKPGNLFLSGGEAGEVKLLDFGIARRAELPRVTQTGQIVGTLGYMAPEQARGDLAIDARADMFALGCILFECFAGRPAFAGARAMEMLAKIVFADVPPLRNLVPDAPPALEALLGRLLAKEPSQRPNGTEVAAALGALRATVERRALGWEAETPQPRSSLTWREQRLLCVVLAASELPLDEASMSTLMRKAAKIQREALQRVAEAHDARLEVLADGSVACALVGTSAATDQAALGARCALALRALLPERRIALSMGRGALDGGLPVGEAIERAASILLTAPMDPLTARARRLIELDELAAGLLDARFEVVASQGGHALLGEREEGARTLLGKPTPFVGRDRELKRLETILAACREEASACAVLVTAGAGMGKSRLCHELLRRVRDDTVEIWTARGDPMQAFAPFELLGQVVRQLGRLQRGEPVIAQRQKLAARIGRHVDEDKRARVTVFLGEMVGTAFPDEADPQLSAARQNAMLMGDQMRRAWVDFVEAECKAKPVILVLEDLHWGDLSTVEYTAAALHTLPDQPLMVLAFARPEVHDVFPSLFPARMQEEIGLTKLSPRACEKLAREVLGAGATRETVAQVVERSEGNAFFLEELLRAAAQGWGEAAPSTVLAMVQSRLEGLALEARRLLRAASVYGQVFWRGGVAALLDEDAPREALDAQLAKLEELEWIVPRWETRFQGEREYMFRHALLRGVAYGMLLEDDRALGHRLAGEWLSSVGELDARVVAEHFNQGGALVRAASWYHRAAAQALEGNDLGAAIERAERAIACGAEPRAVGALCLIQAEAHVWRGDFALAELRGGEATALLEPGTRAWFRAVTQLIHAACKQGAFDRVERWAVAAAEIDALPGALDEQNICLCAGATTLLLGGQATAAEALIMAVERSMADPSGMGLRVLGSLEEARTFRAMLLGDLGAGLLGLKATFAAFEQAGDRRNACATRANLGYSYGELGAYGEAEATLRDAWTEAERMGIPDIAASARASLGQVLGSLGRIAEARFMEEEAISALRRLGDPRLEVAARSYLAKISLLAGDFEAAERDARAAAAILACTPPLRAAAGAIRARALLDLGRAGEARAAAREAFVTLESLRALEEGESLVRLVHAEALAASGDDAAARAAIKDARARLLERAGKIADVAWRESFLQRVPENARTLALAAAWLGEQGRGLG